MDSSLVTLLLTALIITAVNGQINRFINRAWLEMDANSEFYPGGEVISQILQSYGLENGYGQSMYRSPIVDRNTYGRSYPRNRIVNSLYNAYDSDPIAAQQRLDRNYDYVDSTIRDPNNYRYRDNLIDVPRRVVTTNMVSVPRSTYLPDYINRDLPSASYYSRSRSVAAGDPTMSQESLRGRDAARLVPRSTVAPTDANANQRKTIITR